MDKVLLTGFQPFGGESVNPSWLAVRRLGERVVHGYHVVALEVPTVFGKSARVIQEAVERIKPAVVLSVGQAGGVFAVKVERFAINLDDARIPDNEGNQPVDTPIAPDGPPGYFATVPVKKIVETIRADGIPAVLSYSAGTYVCNHVFYSTCHYVAQRRLPIRVGFIHVPFLPEQVVSKPSVPSMSEETIARALEASIKALAV